MTWNKRNLTLIVKLLEYGSLHVPSASEITIKLGVVTWMPKMEERYSVIADTLPKAVFKRRCCRSATIDDPRPLQAFTLS